MGQTVLSKELLYRSCAIWTAPKSDFDGSPKQSFDERLRRFAHVPTIHCTQGVIHKKNRVSKNPCSFRNIVVLHWQFQFRAHDVLLDLLAILTQINGINYPKETKS